MYPAEGTLQELQEAMRRGTYALGAHQSTRRARAPSGKANEGVISPPFACCGKASEGPRLISALLTASHPHCASVGAGSSVLAAGAGGVGVPFPSGDASPRSTPSVQGFPRSLESTQIEKVGERARATLTVREPTEGVVSLYLSLG